MPVRRALSSVAEAAPAAADLDAGEGGDVVRPRRGNQSILIAWRLLSCLMEEGQPMPLKALAAAAGLSASKAHFHLAGLIEVGLVAQSGGSSDYRLGPSALRLGTAFLEQFDLLSTARPAMTDLIAQTGQTVFLGVWGSRGPTIVDRIEGPRTRTIFELRVGSVLPVLTSALGRNFLAHMAEPLTAPFVAAELDELTRLVAAGGVPADPDTPRSAEDVARLREETRGRGLGRSRGGLLSDYTAISAPIFDHLATMIGALTLMGPIGVLDDEADGFTAAALKDAAATISDACGFHHPQPQTNGARQPHEGGRP
jgi:DNA-binding IclR family transcriptional regulator